MRLSRIACTVSVLAVLIGTSSTMAATPSSTRVDMPDSWFYNVRNIDAVRSMEGKVAPELQTQWWRDDSATMKDMRGDIVVLDFWGTWCGPCVRALPKNEELYAKYRDQGVHFVGVATVRGSSRVTPLADKNKLTYPLAIDDRDLTAMAYNVKFYPTYAIVDREGIIQAVGLNPEYLEVAIQKVLEANEAAPAPAETADTLSAPNAEWHERKPNERARLNKLSRMNVLPSIASPDWINGDAVDWEELEGKIVVLDFWATWCGPCIRSIPHNNYLADRFADDDVVIIGVCHPRGVELMADMVERHGIEYPVCSDPDGKINRAYDVNGYPDYYIVDRNGRMRLADCRNQTVDQAIEWLLEEQPKVEDSKSADAN
ncbi:MAG: TlpA disulfide reductase family protein [Planctomycetota bacterium]